jgi:hypothetical protein
MQHLNWVTAPPLVKLEDYDADGRQREDVTTPSVKPSKTPAHSESNHRYTKYELTLKGWSE